MYRYTISDKSGSIQTRPAARKAQMGLVARVVDLMLGWADRMRQRRHLAELDDRLLHDMQRVHDVGVHARVLPYRLEPFQGAERGFVVNGLAVGHDSSLAVGEVRRCARSAHYTTGR